MHQRGVVVLPAADGPPTTGQECGGNSREDCGQADREDHAEHERHNHAFALAEALREDESQAGDGDEPEEQQRQRTDEPGVTEP